MYKIVIIILMTERIEVTIMIKIISEFQKCTKCELDIG